MVAPAPTPPSASLSCPPGCVGAPRARGVDEVGRDSARLNAEAVASLTDCRIEILRRVAQGSSNVEIAVALTPEATDVEAQEEAAMWLLAQRSRRSRTPPRLAKRTGQNVPARGSMRRSIFGLLA